MPDAALPEPSEVAPEDSASSQVPEPSDSVPAITSSTPSTTTQPAATGASAALVHVTAPTDSATAARRRTRVELADLYFSAVAYGVGSGLAVVTFTDTDVYGGPFVPPLVLSGVAMGAVAIADSGDGLRYGVPKAVSDGAFIGFEHALLWSLWQGARAQSGEEWSAEVVASVLWGGATAGALAGGAMGYSGTTPGRAAWVHTTTLVGGTLAGFTTAGIVRDDETLDDKALLGAAIGAAGGTLVGFGSARALSPSLQRVRLLDLGGTAGGLVGAGAYVLLTNAKGTEGGLYWAVDAGVAVGLVVAWMETSRLEPDLGDGPSAAPASLPATVLKRARPMVLPVPGGLQLGLHGVL